MPFSPLEADAFQAQALRAVVSSGIAFRAFEDPEMKILFGTMRSTAPQILPTATSNQKDSINALCANVEFKSYLLELIEATALNKDVPSLCEQFAEMIDRIEVKHDCIIIYFTTDADGGSKKGRSLLGLKQPWLILPSCWTHQFRLILGDYFKVNDAEALIAEDATTLIGWINNHGKVRKCSAIVAAEAGAATSTEAVHLTEDAERFCVLIEDQAILSGLETVLEDLEPICLGTNINQKDSTRLDQLSCFGPNADLNQFKCLNLMISMYRRINNQPNNENTAAECKARGMKSRRHLCDPVQVWRVLAGTLELAELEKFALIILQIVANQAGCKQTFSKTKIEKSDHRNGHGLGKLEKRTKIASQIWSEHQQQGLYKPRKAWKNHKSTANLLSVPCYRDLIDDQDDEDPSECGWRTQMAKWTVYVRAAQQADEEVDGEDTNTAPPQKSAWKSLTLQKLFGGAEKPRTRKPFHAGTSHFCKAKI
ncbi:hypothetical protein C8R44DRAFT_744744 [Mycena epipterygia]|nr:hypothetical protein C8R44DRAFT_744744 [Mycena epipterygia]